MKATRGLTCFFTGLYLVAIFETTIARSDVEPMARLTRPKEIINPEQLKTYLNQIVSYSQSAMGRYGKRSDVTPMSKLDAWEILRMILDAQWRNEQRKQKMRQNKEQVLIRDFQNANTYVDKHTPYIIRPGSFSNVIGKYYDDIE